MSGYVFEPSADSDPATVSRVQLGIAKLAGQCLTCGGKLAPKLLASGARECPDRAKCRARWARTAYGAGRPVGQTAARIASLYAEAVRLGELRGDAPKPVAVPVSHAADAVTLAWRPEAVAAAKPVAKPKPVTPQVPAPWSPHGAPQPDVPAAGETLIAAFASMFARPERPTLAARVRATA